MARWLIWENPAYRPTEFSMRGFLGSFFIYRPTKTPFFTVNTINGGLFEVFFSYRPMSCPLVNMSILKQAASNTIFNSIFPYSVQKMNFNIFLLHTSKSNNFVSAVLCIADFVGITSEKVNTHFVRTMRIHRRLSPRRGRDTTQNFCFSVHAI